MFSRLVALLPLATLVAVAAAAGNSNCSSGTAYCCNKVFKSALPFTGVLGGVLTAVAGTNVPAGLSCNTVAVISATGGTKCSTQTACCTKSDQVGTADVQCAPIDVDAL